MIGRFLRTHRAIYVDRDSVHQAAVGEDRGLASPWLILGVGVVMLGAFDLWLSGGAPLFDDPITAWLPWNLCLPQFVAWLVLLAAMIGVTVALRTPARPLAIARLWAFAVGHVATVLVPLAVLFVLGRPLFDGSVPETLAGVFVLLISLAAAAWLAAGLRRLAGGRWLPAIVAIVLGYAGSAAVAEARKEWVARNFSIVGGSMLPALDHGDMVVTSRVALATRDPKPGDIVVYTLKPTSRNPGGGTYVHRVVAVAGDRIGFAECGILINGKAVRVGEPDRASGRYDRRFPSNPWYASESLGGRTVVTAFSNARDPICQSSETVVPARHVFVAGDHRDNAVDSRQPSHGPVAYESIIGLVVFRYLPRARRGRP